MSNKAKIIMKHRTRIILTGMIGNLVESYDMAICGLLSVYFVKYLASDTLTGMLAVFATFFAGYLARPIGAVFLGLLSDIYGRKITLAASILFMGIATALIGFIPNNSVMGIASMGCLLILRIIQSFSCGSEYLNSSTYLVENAAASYKGYAGSWASFGAVAGLLIASIVTLVISYCMDTYPELEKDIWRIPFILALLGSTVGLYIRSRIPESLEYIMHYAENPKPKFGSLFNQAFKYVVENKLKTLYVFALSCLGVTSTFLIYIYGPIQAHIYGNFNEHQIIISNIIALSVMLLVSPIVGRLTDKMNREKIICVASCGFWVLSIPFFYFLSSKYYVALVLIQALIALPASAYSATVTVMLTEMFPINMRCTVLSLLYATAASLAAGLTPLLSLMLLRSTNQSIAPTILIIVLIALVWGVMWMQHLKEKKLEATSREVMNTF